MNNRLTDQVKYILDTHIYREFTKNSAIYLEKHLEKSVSPIVLRTDRRTDKVNHRVTSLEIQIN